MLQIKGTALKSTINYIKTKLNEEERIRFETLLSEKAKSLLGSPVLSGSWYDVSLMAEIMSKVPEIIKKEPKEIWWEMGRHSCDDGLSTVYKIFYKLGNPEFIIKRAAQVWNNYYTEGDFFVVSHSFNSAHVQIKNVSFSHISICTRISGWMERAMELSGGKNVKLRHSICKFQSGTIEEWKANWD